MDAATVKAALRSRHHAAGGVGQMVGEWTCVEELWGIDLLAWSAWGRGQRIGYEVKISRSDYRRELLDPTKRDPAKAKVHEFYFAVPKGLLTKDELAYREPGDLRVDKDFAREPCPGFTFGGPVRETRAMHLFDGRDAPPPRPVYGGMCRKNRRARYDSTDGPRGHVVALPRPFVFTPDPYAHRGDAGPSEPEVREASWAQGTILVTCPTCGGRGYVAKSRMETEAPTLWVPADVGLVEILESGNVRTVRKAPPLIPAALSDRDVAAAFRWASVRPDPRHVAARVEDRVRAELEAAGMFRADNVEEAS